MIAVRSIDSGGDWNFGKGKSDYRYDLDAVTQNIKTRLLSFLGDCFFDQTSGIDWFHLLGSKKQTELNLSVSAVILNTYAVTKILDYTISLDQNRNLLISYEVATIFGTSTNSFQLALGELI